jgi:hypothetical protein
MTIFSSTTSPGQRWKMFLPGTASIRSNVLSMSTASALFRSRWLNAHTRRSRPRTVAGWRPRAVIQLGDVTHRVLPTSVPLISWRNCLKTGDGGHELPKIWPKNSEIDSISVRELIYANDGRLETFATSGYARGLRTREILSKIDTSHDGRISHDE